MLKKRILASSMASVMALGSVSVVAFADEAKDYGEAVTKAELQEYIDSVNENYINNGAIDEFGTKQAERFGLAVGHAETVLADSKAAAKDYTAAYQMVKAVEAKLEKYTAEQLKALIDDYQSIYDGNNILNEEYQDNIYAPNTYSTFVFAFEDAKYYADTDETRYITDAYIALYEAKEGLKDLDPVSKSDFRAAWEAYQNLELEMKKVESWRRGTISVIPETGTAAEGDVKKIVNSKYVVTMADLRKMVYGSSVFYDGETSTTGGPDTTAENTEAGKRFQYIKDGVLTYVEFSGTVIGNTSVDGFIVNDTDTGLFDAIKTLQNNFVEAKGVVETTRPDMKAAYEACVEAVEVFKSWKADSYSSGRKDSCASLEKKYHNQLVEKYNTAGAFALFNGDICSDGTLTTKRASETVSSLGGATIAADGDKTVADEITSVKFTYDPDKHTLTADKALVILKYKDSGLMFNATAGTVADVDFFDNTDDAVAFRDYASSAANSSASNLTTQSISAGTDILQYITHGLNDSAKYNIESTNATDADWDAVQKAFAFYNEYLATTFGTGGITQSGEEAWTIMNDGQEAGSSAAPYFAFKALADGKTFSKLTGSSAEWTLIWRNLAYALEDKFPVAVAAKAHTLNELQALYNESFKLADKTGDAALFAEPYAELTNARAVAAEFIKIARSTTGYKVEDELDLIDTEIPGDSSKSDDVVLEEVWEYLNGAYETLSKWYADFQYSYDEIRADIAEVAAAVDKGDVTGDDLLAALEQCAYDLSVLEPSDITDTLKKEANLAFDDDRTFQPYNRLKTGKTFSGAQGQSASEKALKTSYEALLAAYEKALTPSTDVEGDVDGDGAVTILDVIAVADAYLEGLTDAQYDINEDGSVDFLDLVEIADLYLATLE